jgi:hypothetical protein
MTGYRAAALLLCTLAALAIPTGASAKYRFSAREFQTPSKNIICGWHKESGHQASIRCDLRHSDNPPGPRPKSCEGDWGFSYFLSKHGKAIHWCVSDAPTENPDPRVLAYGRRFSRGGITCTSRQVGLRCHNRTGHGFKLSRAVQTLF